MAEKRDRKAAALAGARVAAARVESGMDRLRVVEPILERVATTLRGLGRVVAGLSLLGGAGAVLLVLLAVRSFGWWGLLIGVVGVAPRAGWKVGRRATRAAGLIGDYKRVLEMAQSAGEAGHRWLASLSEVGRAGGAQRAFGVAKVVIGAGRAVWQSIDSHVEGADDLRALALWPRTTAMVTAGVLSPILLAIALFWGLLAVLF